jgi:NADH-quinone oxidoreductase subunit E
MLSAQALQEVQAELAKYPPEHSRAALLAALRITQRETGWLSEAAMRYVAELLGLRPIEVLEVATFYSMYDTKPAGRKKICLCTNVSCMLRGSDAVAEHVKRKLGVGFGETTADGKYTLKEVECLAACGGAPCMQIGDRYYENLTPERVDEILAQLEQDGA